MTNHLIICVGCGVQSDNQYNGKIVAVLLHSTVNTPNSSLDCSRFLRVSVFTVCIVYCTYDPVTRNRNKKRHEAWRSVKIVYVIQFHKNDKSHVACLASTPFPLKWLFELTGITTRDLLGILMKKFRPQYIRDYFPTSGWSKRMRASCRCSCPTRWCRCPSGASSDPSIGPGASSSESSSNKDPIWWLRYSTVGSPFSTPTIMDRSNNTSKNF